MFKKYLKKKTRFHLKRYLEKKYVVLPKKKRFDSKLSPWREDFFNMVDKKITDDVKIILEIGDGDGALSYKLSKKYNDRFFYGIDNSTASFKENNYYHLNMNATDIFFNDNFFDFIFSHNAFEHINGLERTIKEVSRILKPNGRFYTIFGPLWTTAYGHHFYEHTEDKVSSVFPPYCHLYLNDKELVKLIKKQLGVFSRKRIVAEDHLIGGVNNKLLPEDYRNIFKNRNDLKIIMFNELTSHQHCNFKISDLPKNPQDRFKTLQKDDYNVFGFEIEGIKLS